jgi:histone-lysine N-methyltransferase SETMAR
VPRNTEKRRGMLTRGVVLLHDNARPHTAAQTQALIMSFGWEQMNHSPDLAPSDFHLFLHLKKFLAGQHFNIDEDVKRAVQKWLFSQAATFYDEGIQKLVSRYDKCLNNGGNCVEK